jgi:parvulin-like peptidyl-prolyl isomerase
MKANANFSTTWKSPVKRFLSELNSRINRPVAGAALVVTAALAISCNNTPTEEIAARVGSRDITIRQIDIVIKRQLDASGAPSGSIGPSEIAAARLSVLENMIQEEALFQKAKRENLVPDDNKVRQAIEKRKQDASLTEEQYQTQIKQAGMTDEDVKEQVQKELAIEALKDREKARVKAPTEEEIRKYYDDHREEFVAARGAEISIIVTDPADNGYGDDAKSAADAEQKIRAIYERLKAGSDFAEVASQRSEDQSNIRGGRLGFAPEAALRQSLASRPEVADRLMAMTPGQYTEPIKDNLAGRWYIFKLNNKREQSQNLTFEDVRRNIVETITQQRQQILLNALLMLCVTETTVKNLLAERIVEKPETMVVMRPSRLITDREPVQPPPRIENDNSSSQNSNTASPANSNSASGGNANRSSP